MWVALRERSSAYDTGHYQMPTFRTFYCDKVYKRYKCRISVRRGDDARVDIARALEKGTVGSEGGAHIIPLERMNDDAAPRDITIGAHTQRAEGLA